MKNWFKSYWSACLSIIAVVISIAALFRTEPLTLSDSFLEWAITICIALISIGVVMVLGYQIYNSTTLDKRMNDMFDKKTEGVRESLSISNARAITAVLYQAEGINLKLAMGTNDYISVSKTLSQMVECAMLLNENDRISDIAKLIANSKLIIDNRGVKIDSLNESFLKLSQVVLTRLPASDVHALQLLHLVQELEASADNDDKGMPQKEKRE